MKKFNSSSEGTNFISDLVQPYKEPLPLCPVDIKTCTKKVSFSHTGYLEGPMTANACVEVYTSDGEQGTLTHLMIGTDTKAFAQDLKEMLGKTGIPTLLAGGDSTSNESIRLMTGLKQSLSATGFKIIDTHLGGRCSRKSILQNDRVELEVKDYLDGITTTRKKVLFF